MKLVGRIVALLTFVFAMAWVFNAITAVSVMSSQERELPIYCVDTTEKKIGISFDAAWGDEHTEEILSVLKEHNCHATFFLVNFWAEKYPEDVKLIYEAGHEIGSHSATHPDMTALTEQQIADELDKTEETIVKIIGQRPTLFRPPYGAYDNHVIKTCKEQGYEIIQWSVDSLDWKKISAEQIVDRVTRNIKPGDIVFFHNNEEKVEEYLPVILDKLQEQGYEIVPVGELILKCEYEIDPSGKQIQKKSIAEETENIM